MQVQAVLVGEVGKTTNNRENLNDLLAPSMDRRTGLYHRHWHKLERVRGNCTCNYCYGYHTFAAVCIVRVAPTTNAVLTTYVHTQGIAGLLSEHGCTAAIVSGDQAGLTPFER